MRTATVLLVLTWLASIHAFLMQPSGEGSPPTIQASSPAFIVGQERTLACYTSSAEPTSTFPLRWYKNGDPLSAYHEETTPLGQGGVTSYSSFYRSLVTAADNLHVLSCMANFPSFTTMASYTIYVYKGPDKPVITGPNVTVSGRSSSWTCVVDGASSTAPHVFWQFANGTRLSANLYQNSDTIHFESYSLEIHKVTSVLTLTVTSGVSSLTLTCQAVHFETMTSMSASIAVTVSPLGQAFSLRQLIGICVEMCASDADCRPGQHCLSNGCGHTCQARFHIVPIGVNCGPVCDIYCANGNVLDANGCPTCSCHPGGDIAVAA